MTNENGFADQHRVCAECEATFTYSAEDQERHEAKGWQAPRRCFRCRAARRAAPPVTPNYNANRAQPPFRTW
jgi:hypothetical protein